MAYIGQTPFQEFTEIPTKDNFTGDGSTTTFDLASAVSIRAENALEVFVANVRQEPGTGKAFTLGQDGSGDFKRITFTSAPSNGAAIYVMYTGVGGRSFPPTAELPQDLDGAELILDADADTSITADTDDTIDIKIGGADDFQFTANKFSVLSGSHVTFADSSNAKFGTGSDMLLYHDGTNSYITNSQGALKIATETSGIAVTIGHTTSEVTIADNLTVTGNASIGGNFDVTGTFDMSDADITNIGSIALDTITNDGTDITLDSSGDIILDAGGDTIFLKDSGTTFGSLDNSSSNLIIKSGTTTAATFSGANVTLAGTLGVGAITGTSTITGGGLLTTGGNIVIPNAGNIGSASDTDAIAISSGGVVTMNQIPVFSAGINVSGGTIAGTLATAAQGSVTSLGTLTALTVDDVAINTKSITMTGSSGDTAVMTVATNGALSLVTTDAAAAAANIQITADGTAELAGTTVTLDSAGGITLDADNGTITFADAGSGLGTITSSGYSGTAAVATAVTITDNESTDENNVIVFVAGADADGGNVGLESDGHLTYNPSSGTLTTTNLVTSGTHTVTNSVTMNASNAVVFEGATADDFETTLTTIDTTGSDKTISLPNVSGTLPVLAAVSATAITTTPAELNLIDGGTARGTDALASGDGILINDGGTMKMTNVDTVSTYFSSHTVGGGNILTTGALDSGSITSGFGAIDNGTSGIRTATFTAETAFVPSASDGATLGTAALEFSDLYLADAGTIQFGDDQDVTLTHVVDTGLLLSSTDRLQFGDSGTYIFQSADGVLDLVSDTEIELNATTLDINANVEISGTATTTGVHTFTAVPVLPANSIDSAHYVDGSIDNAHIGDDQIDSEHYTDGSIDNAHIADDAIDSEHYVDGSIDTAHIADNAVTLAKMAGLARGKLIYGDASGNPAALAVGSADQILKHDGTDFAWQDAPASDTSALYFTMTQGGSISIAGSNTSHQISA